ncbi:GNAT family N-acetyltransferase [Flavobacterium coralii]|uniref:GNAT family N-acetyltransferase n=1 Tax=Flavobacterium coralii TaxID=2838017 RepID=UPI00268BF761|tara:strand:+ start:85006 stop:85473 length:468 start_codon:yes stop_codon:yes gene_type:complete
MEIKLKPFKAEDAPAIVALFRNTVRTVNVQHYNEAQIKAWAPDVIYEDKWAEKLLKSHTVVAWHNDTLCGFGDIDATGYLDHLFVHKDYQGCGVATLIEKEIEKHARNQGHSVITVAASITAKPFFLKKGYRAVREQQVTFNGQVFTNFFMEKVL